MSDDGIKRGVTTVSVPNGPGRPHILEHLIARRCAVLGGLNLNQGPRIWANSSASQDEDSPATFVCRRQLREVSSIWSGMLVAVGIYNRLLTQAACQHCDETVERVLQFKFGACNLNDYVVGDSVDWATGRRGGVVNHGEPVAGRAWVPAYPEEPCPSCGADFALAEFAVVVNGNTLTGFEQAPMGFHFPEENDVVLLPTSTSDPVPVPG